MNGIRRRPLLATALLLGLGAGALFLRGLARRDSGRAENAPPSFLLTLESVGAQARIMRSPLSHGQFRPGEIVWEGPTREFGHSRMNGIVDGRYAVSSGGLVLDAVTGAVLQDHQGANDVQIDGRVVTFAVMDAKRERGVFEFNIDTRQRRKLSEIAGSRYGLPGVASPDGTKSLSQSVSIQLHQRGRPPRDIAECGISEQSVASSSFGAAPILWLDNDRFLTQTKNGVLVALTTAGAATPIVTIPECLGKQLVGGASLQRDRGGRIIYTCGKSYVVDVAGGTWKLCEWYDAGHEFEIQWEPVEGGGAVRYRGEEIGRVDCLPRWPNQVATAPGRIAIVKMDRDHLGAFATGTFVKLRAWTTDTREWDETHPEWPAAILGWVR